MTSTLVITGIKTCESPEGEGEHEGGVSLVEREGALSKDLSEGRNGALSMSMGSTGKALSWLLCGMFQEGRERRPGS